MSKKNLSLAVAATMGSLAIGCDLNVPDLNNPAIEQLEDTPTAISVNTATTGLLIGQRNSKSATVGLVNQLGILGREAYDFDPNDNRFTTEELQGILIRNSAFGIQFWNPNYANIRLGNIILHAVDKVADYTPEQKAGIKGFVHTIQATDLITVIATRDTIGAVIDTDRPLGAPLAPIEKRDVVYQAILDLLDTANTELAAAGESFTFKLSPGYATFNTPESFAKFNRALKARVAAHFGSFAYVKGDAANVAARYGVAKAALAQSFIDDTSEMIDLKRGVYYVYSLAAGDQTNALISTAIFAHPKLATEAESQLAEPAKKDARLLAKVEELKSPVTAFGLTTNIKFKMYTNISPIPLIRNEELILLKAEILWFTGDKAGATDSLNLIRTTSGLLAPIAQPATDAAFVTALLNERRYSLLYEGGHRWIDLRRFGIELPLDLETHVRNVRYPLPQPECDARPDEPRCALTSKDPVPAELQ